MKVIQVHYMCGHSYPQTLGLGGETGQASDIIGHLTLEQGQICGPCRETLRRNLEEEYIMVQNDLTATFERELEVVETMGEYQAYSDMLSIEASLIHRREEVDNLGPHGNEIEHDYVIPPTLEDDDSNAIVFLPTLNVLGERIRHPPEPERLVLPYGDTNEVSIPYSDEVSTRQSEVAIDNSSSSSYTEGFGSQAKESGHDTGSSNEYELPRFVMDPSPEPGVLTNDSPFTYDGGFRSQSGESSQAMEQDQEYTLQQSVGDWDHSESVSDEPYILSSPTFREGSTLDFSTPSDDLSLSASNPFFAISHLA